MVKITLEDFELRWGTMVGIERRLISLKNSFYREPYATKMKPNWDGWGMDIEGACAELAVAKFLGLYWNGFYTTNKEIDIDPDIQVKFASGEPPAYHLRIPANATDIYKYVFVTGKNKEYRIWGWILAGDGKRKGKLEPENNGIPPSYLVGVEDLHSIEDLRIDI